MKSVAVAAEDRCTDPDHTWVTIQTAGGPIITRCQTCGRKWEG